MKASHLTFTATVIVPAGHVPASVSLPDVAYRCAVGLMSLQTFRVRERPATREEIERATDFLAEFDVSLAEWERAHQNDEQPANRRARSLAFEIKAEGEPDAAEPVTWRGALQLIAQYGGKSVGDEHAVECSGSWCAEQARSALEATSARPARLEDSAR